MTVTPSAIKPSRLAVLRTRIAAETIAAGQLVYKTTPGTAGVAAGNLLAKSQIIGIAANSATVGNPVVYVESDPLLEVGGSHRVGEVYIATSAGQFIRASDNYDNCYSCVVAVVVAATKWRFSIVNTTALRSTPTPADPFNLLYSGDTLSWEHYEPVESFRVEVQISGGDWSSPVYAEDLSYTYPEPEGVNPGTSSAAIYDARINASHVASGLTFTSGWATISYEVVDI